MSKVLITESYLYDIANAIRARQGVETLYRPSDMAAAIQNLSSLNIEVVNDRLVFSGIGVSIVDDAVVLSDT